MNCLRVDSDDDDDERGSLVSRGSRMSRFSTSMSGFKSIGQKAKSKLSKNRTPKSYIDTDGQEDLTLKELRELTTMPFHESGRAEDDPLAWKFYGFDSASGYIEEVRGRSTSPRSLNATSRCRQPKAELTVSQMKQEAQVRVPILPSAHQSVPSILGNSRAPSKHVMPFSSGADFHRRDPRTIRKDSATLEIEPQPWKAATQSAIPGPKAQPVRYRRRPTRTDPSLLSRNSNSATVPGSCSNGIRPMNSSGYQMRNPRRPLAKKALSSRTVPARISEETLPGDDNDHTPSATTTQRKGLHRTKSKRSESGKAPNDEPSHSFILGGHHQEADEMVKADPLETKRTKHQLPILNAEPSDFGNTSTVFPGLLEEVSAEMSFMPEAFGNTELFGLGEDDYSFDIDAAIMENRLPSDENDGTTELSDRECAFGSGQSTESASEFTAFNDVYDGVSEDFREDVYELNAAGPCMIPSAAELYDILCKGTNASMTLINIGDICDLFLDPGFPDTNCDDETCNALVDAVAHASSGNAISDDLDPNMATSSQSTQIHTHDAMEVGEDREPLLDLDTFETFCHALRTIDARNDGQSQADRSCGANSIPYDVNGDEKPALVNRPTYDADVMAAWETVLNQEDIPETRQPNNVRTPDPASTSLDSDTDERESNRAGSLQQWLLYSARMAVEPEHLNSCEGTQDPEATTGTAPDTMTKSNKGDATAADDDEESLFMFDDSPGGAFEIVRLRNKTAVFDAVMALCDDGRSLRGEEATMTMTCCAIDALDKARSVFSRGKEPLSQSRRSDEERTQSHIESDVD